MFHISSDFNKKIVLLGMIVFSFLFVSTNAIQCYKCKGDDECDFTKRIIHVENCTWATKCWGARIGDHFIRGCADDRCDIQLGFGSFIESKCCYSDKCNNERFFFPNNASKFLLPVYIHITMIILVLYLIF